MKLFSLKNRVISTILGSLVLLGADLTANAQTYNQEYREWQSAQRDAQREYQDYLRSRSRSDYRDWQRAQRRAQQEYAEYQRSSRFGTRTYNTYNTGNRRFYRVYRNG